MSIQFEKPEILFYGQTFLSRLKGKCPLETRNSFGHEALKSSQYPVQTRKKFKRQSLVWSNVWTMKLWNYRDVRRRSLSWFLNNTEVLKMKLWNLTDAWSKLDSYIWYKTIFDEWTIKSTLVGQNLIIHSHTKTQISRQTAVKMSKVLLNITVYLSG